MRADRQPRTACRPSDRLATAPKQPTGPTASPAREVATTRLGPQLGAVGPTEGALQLATAPLQAASEPRALCVDVPEFSAVLRVSERHLRAMLSNGRLPQPLKFGRRRVWPLAEIEAWLAAGAPTRAVWESRRSERARR